MSNVAIVGGSGFIGTSTAKQLLANGHKVIIIDIQPPSVAEAKYIYADVRNYESILCALGKYDIDSVFMLAAIHTHEENIKIPRCAANTNIIGLMNVLDAMDCLGISHIIFSSSVWVYSTCDVHSVDEDTSLLIQNSKHIYTTTKISSESLILNYHQMKGLDYTILRYGIAYGINSHPSAVFYKFLSDAIKTKSLTIVGDGSNSRRFLYVDDHGMGNCMALERSARNQIINLDGCEDISVLDVAQRVQELLSIDLNIVHINERGGDYTGKNVCCAKAEKLLGWKPKTDFITGTRKIYENFVG